MKSFTKHFKPVYLVVLVNIIGYSLLYFYTKPFQPAVIYTGVAIITLICLTYALILKLKLGDEYLFLIVSMLVSIGIVMLYRLDRALAIKQFIWLTCGIGMYFLCYYIYLKLDIWDKLLYYYLGLSLILFLLTQLLGSNVNGAKNWIIIGSINIQPSEIIKLSYVMFLASYYVIPDKLQIRNFKLLGREFSIGNRLIFIFISYCHIGFLVLQKELGTAFLIFFVFFTFLFIFGSSLKAMLVNAAVACLGGILSYFAFYHIKVRVDMWLNPWADISNKGYQITQSLFAIGSGGFFGTGLGLGSPDLIPIVHSDFIFSAICEEMGIFGGIAVIFLFFIFVYRGIKISLTVKKPFDKIASLAITSMFGLQTFIILGGVIKLIPLTGITLPFISYGGSALVSGFVSLGILQAISSQT